MHRLASQEPEPDTEYVRTEQLRSLQAHYRLSTLATGEALEEPTSSIPFIKRFQERKAAIRHLGSLVADPLGVLRDRNLTPETVEAEYEEVDSDRLEILKQRYDNIRAARVIAHEAAKRSNVALLFPHRETQVRRKAAGRYLNDVLDPFGHKVGRNG